MYLADLEIHPGNAKKRTRKDTRGARIKQIRIAPYRRLPPGVLSRNPNRHPSFETVYFRLAAAYNCTAAARKQIRR